MSGIWRPTFACPECEASLCDPSRGAIRCSSCASDFEWRDDCFRFLAATRLAAMQPFVRQYRAVREQDGYRVARPEYYRMLPAVAPDDPHAPEWRLRRESYRYLRDRVLPIASSRRVLDVGAGNGWLSHRLASLGHHVVAVDLLDDDQDGLGACRHYETPFTRVQADFDALPFAGGQFDVIVFNGSLHYSPDVPATLARARRLLASSGTLVVMDSPMFRADADGQLMVTEKLRRFRSDYGLTDIVHPSVGFLTVSALAEMGARIGLCGRFVQSRGPLGWRVRRRLGSLRQRRVPASFGVWVAQ